VQEGTIKLSKNESIKESSEGLAGTIAEVYSGEASHFDDPDMQLLKFHGTYQQDDRDLRAERRKAKLDKAWSFMVRAKIPGGLLTAEQFLSMIEIGRGLANDSVRITSRQGIQFHGVGKENLKGVMRAIHEARLTTLGACGDLNRNTMCCPVADLDWRRGLGMGELCNQIADHFTPRATAYWEIWCDGEKWGEKLTRQTEEPIYGKAYLPRKFKMAVCLPEDNCVDVYTQDLGAEAVHEDGRLLAYDLIVGGGMGFTHGQEKTFPRLGSRLLRVPPADALAVIETIFKVQRDHGNRSDRKLARMKYLIETRGEDWFKQEIFSRIGKEYPDAGPMPEYKVGDHLGWNEGPEDKLFVGIHVANGRLADGESGALLTGMREVVERFRPEVRLTARQNVVLAGIDPADQAEVQRMLDANGLSTNGEPPNLRRLAMACVALPTCHLALAEAERQMPTLLDQLEDLGVAAEPVELRMTGCPNSCVRSPMSEIGLVGRGPGKYAVYLGGNQEGTRLAFSFKERVDESELGGMISRLIQAWRRETGRGVSFGDWARAKGGETLAELI